MYTHFGREERRKLVENLEATHQQQKAAVEMQHTFPNFTSVCGVSPNKVKLKGKAKDERKKYLENLQIRFTCVLPGLKVKGPFSSSYSFTPLSNDNEMLIKLAFVQILLNF